MPIIPKTLSGQHDFPPKIVALAAGLNVYLEAYAGDVDEDAMVSCYSSSRAASWVLVNFTNPGHEGELMAFFAELLENCGRWSIADLNRLSPSLDRMPEGRAFDFNPTISEVITALVSISPRN